MPSQVPAEKLGDAILQSVQHGGFPQDEDVASASVSASTLPTVLEAVRKAREDTKNEVRAISREAASDVDGWVTQARKLQDDIKRSQDTAEEISQEAENGKSNTARVEDAASKVSLLHTEISYTESLSHVLEQLRDISTLLDSAQDASRQGNLIHALERLEDADSAFKSLGPFEATRAVVVLRTKQDQLRNAITENVTKAWNGLIFIDESNKKISMRESIEAQTAISVNTVVEALSRLSLLDSFISRLSRDLDRIVAIPRFKIGENKSVTAFEVKGDDIELSTRVNDGSVKAAIADIQLISDYLSTRLPSSVAVALSSKLVPAIISRLINNLLLPSVPTSINEIHKFQDDLAYALGLVEYFDELGWSGQNHLTEWVDKSAEVWLAKQKEFAIAKVQTIFPKRVQEKKKVERVETQVVSKGDALHTAQGEEEDDWGADWDEAEPTKESTDKPEEVEEEDMSAWGEEDDEDSKAPGSKDTTEGPKHVEEDGEEDWGAEWGDDDAEKPAGKPAAAPKVNGKSEQKPSVNQEITLRETYTVTAMPDAIIEIILQVIHNVEKLNSPDLVKTAIAPASGGLYAIPGLLLAMYRATAATHYSRDPAGNMLIYNDCQRLSDRLRNFITEQSESDNTSSLPQQLRPSTRLKSKLETDIKIIDGFGKRAYGREMESQRQIIRDHLEDAQGFQGCTNVPFASVCDDAIATTIDRISDVKRQWQNVLSHSALLQSLGSLVSTALTKFVNDVEDMSDIAEEESRKLRGYCMSLATLAQHFQTEDDNGELRDMASIYMPNWFKFQYLSEILDSSLADIKYLWTDGELKLEMEGEEVIGLIEALFAPSDHRRRAIGEIRRTSLH